MTPPAWQMLAFLYALGLAAPRVDLRNDSRYTLAEQIAMDMAIFGNAYVVAGERWDPLNVLVPKDLVLTGERSDDTDVVRITKHEVNDFGTLVVVEAEWARMEDVRLLK